MRLCPSGQAARTWRTGDDCWIVRGKVVRRGRVESIKSGAADVRLAGKSGTATVLVRELYWSHHAAKTAYLQAALGADPRPVVVAAEGCFVVMHDTVFVNLLEGKPGYSRQYKYVGTRGEAVAFCNGQNALTVWRILLDGEHEAAIEAARLGGAEAALHHARRTLLDLADDFDGEHAAGLRHAVRCIYDMIQATKGQAK